jgi:hypothetical protein
MRSLHPIFRVLGLGLGSLLAWLPVAAQADTRCDGVQFADKVRSLETGLTLNGLGLRTATFLKVHVYVAALYVEATTHKAKDILDPARSKQLSLHFVRDVSRDEMFDAIHHGIKDNTSGAELTSAEAHLKNFQRVLPELRKGTVLHLAYRPKHGLHVYQGMKLLGVENDDSFANLLFRVWLGPKPPDTDLKAGLLGNAACD